MSDRTTFRLPGHEFNPFAERKCLLSLLAAYSRQWNPRNLESPWYEPWAQIFADLVAGHSSLSVAPQLYLWHDSQATSQAYTTPGPSYLLANEDESLPDESLDDVGNITLDSIRSISIPSHRHRTRIPDFAITRKVSFLRPVNSSHTMHLPRRVTYLGIPVLAELKCSGARCHDIHISLSNAMPYMILARNQLRKQAYHLFQMYPHQETVILIAISGFWWSYAILPRTQSVGYGLLEEEEEEEELDSGLHDHAGVHAILEQNPWDSEQTPIQDLRAQLYGFPPSALQGTVYSKICVEKVRPHDQMYLREDGWSDFLLYGTAASNQVLSLLLERLHSVVHVHYDGTMG